MIILLVMFCIFSLIGSESTAPVKKKRHRSHESITITIDPATENKAAVHHVTVDRTDSPHTSKDSETPDNPKQCMSSRAQLALISSASALVSAGITLAITLNTNNC